MTTQVIRDFNYWLYCPIAILKYWIDNIDLLDEAARTALEAIEAFADEQAEAA